MEKISAFIYILSIGSILGITAWSYTIHTIIPILILTGVCLGYLLGTEVSR